MSKGILRRKAIRHGHPHRAPRHPVMSPCLETVANRDLLWLRWASSFQSHCGRLRFGFCLGRSLNFKVSNQTL